MKWKRPRATRPPAADPLESLSLTGFVTHTPGMFHRALSLGWAGPGVLGDGGKGRSGRSASGGINLQ